MDNKIIDKIPTLKLSPLQKFNEIAKLQKLAKSDDPKNWPEDWKKVHFKGYPRLPAIKLPSPFIDKKIPFIDVFSRRKSNREFSGQGIGFQEISSLLFYSCGVREKVNNSISFRFYPSAGARYPLEIYPILLRGNREINQGVYHYHVRTHSLEILFASSFKRSLFRCFSQPWIKKAAMLVAISAVFFRTETKYGTRSYRYIMSESGHLSQNLYLTSTALKLGCCSIGGYRDNDLDKILDIDGLEESTIGVVAVGPLKNE